MTWWQLYYHMFPFVMMTKKESFFLHLFIVSFLTFIGYGVYSCIPLYVPFMAARGYYYVTGQGN